MRVLLAAEILAARAAAGLSRLTGRGGGTTVPGKLLWKLDPGAIERLARRLPRGLRARLRDERQDDDGRDGGRDPPPHASRSRTTPRARTSCRASPPTLLARRGAELGLFEVDEARAARGRARACGRARSASATSSATSSTATASSSSSPSAGATRSSALPGGAALVVNGDDPQVGDLARVRPGATVFGARRPAASLGRRSSTRPTRSTASRAGRRTSTPPRTSATSATTAARPAATPARRSTSSRATSSSPGSTARRSRSSRPSGTRRVRLRVPGLYNVYNALAAASLARALGVALDDVVGGARALRRRVRPLRADRRSATGGC